ncbi:MAG TPA: hypothetical protein VKB84_23030 [Candidatus Binataceae bacterium]|nr:hypothetical protein [Candidatus Binataceae bacterium]
MSNPAVQFPSTQWFEHLAARMNDQRAKYQNFGFVTARAVFRIAGTPAGTRNFGLTFDGFECLEVRELADGAVAPFDPDWIIEGDYSTWKEMVANIKAHGEADPDHTLNRLCLLGHPLKVHGEDQTRVDVFYRQLFSFQAFIDESAALETSFA